MSMFAAKYYVMRYEFIRFFRIWHFSPGRGYYVPHDDRYSSLADAKRDAELLRRIFPFCPIIVLDY